MIERGVVGTVDRVEDGKVTVHLPGDDIRITITQKLDIPMSGYSRGDQVILLSTRVNRWVVLGKVVDV